MEKISIYLSRKFPFLTKGAEMSAYGKSIFAYNPSSKIAKAYEDFAKEVAQLEKQLKPHKIDIIR